MLVLEVIVVVLGFSEGIIGRALAWLRDLVRRV